MPPVGTHIRQNVHTLGMAESSRKRYRRCDPSDEFESMMRWYQSYPGIECTFVPCDLLTPDYSILEKPQLNYYLWWRKNLAEGRLLQSDRGYVWLRLCEIINMSEPEEALREIALLKDHAEEIDVFPEHLDRVAADVCIANGLRVPPADYGKDDVARGILISETLWDPSCIDRSRLRALIGDGKADSLSGTPDGLNEFVRLLESVGTDEYLLGTETSIRMLFPNHVRFESSMYMVTYDVYSDDLFHLLEDICSHITGEGAPSRSFLERMDESVERRSVVKRTKNGSIRVPVSKRDVDLMDMGTDLFGEEPPTGRRGTDSVVVRGPEGPLGGFIGSDSSCPDYRKLSDKQKAFYARWSSEADAGRLHDTDTGYIWMRLCGLVNSTEDHSTILKRLMSMHRAYSGSIASALIRKTCMDFVLKNRIHIPDSSLANSDDEAGMVMGQYLSGCMDAKPDKDVLLRIAGLLGTSTDDFFDPTMAEAMRRTLMNASSELLRAKKKDAVALCKKSIHTRKLYEGLAYYRSDREDLVAKIQFTDFAGDPDMRSTFSELATYIVEESRRISSGLPRVGIEVFGIREEKLVEFLLTGSVADRKSWDKGPMKVNLNKDAINQAESDLKDVTSMMQVEEEEETAEEEEEVAEAPMDPWEAFSEGLDDDQKEYLSRACEGCRSDFKAEKAINSLAMDTVGDVVVQDGVVIEDYMEDVRRAVGGPE